jgi:hypothetical protein
MTTAYKGINYAGPASNVNKNTETGIRFGVLPQNEVLQAWADSSEGFYGKPHCPNCGNEAVACDQDKHGEYASQPHECDDFACEACERNFGSESAFPDSPISFSYEQDGYTSECGEDGDIFILRSPYFTYAQFCSPCAPGACYLLNALESHDADNKAYCFGHDWFEDGQAPYPVYSVATGELVMP